MIRIFNVYFASRTLLLVFSEMLVLVLASLPAAFLVLGADAELMYSDGGAVLKLLLVVAICMALMHYFDLYESMILFKPAQAAVRVLQVLGISCVILSAIYHLYPDIEIQPDLMVLWVVLAGVSLIAWRRLFTMLNQSSRHAQRTLVLGTGPLAGNLIREIESRPELGLELVGYVDPNPASSPAFLDLEYWRDQGDWNSRLESNRIQRLILASQATALIPLLATAKERGIIINPGPDIYEAITGRVDLNSLHSTVNRDSRLRPLVRIYKRLSSVVLSLIGLLLTLPLMMVIAIAIRLDSRGPVIFRQRRIGKGGKEFTLYKFRSMQDGADGEGPARAAAQNDRRCTRVGKHLRRTHLDELPQLFNILRGDMYFIGPRPFAVEMEHDLAKEIPFYSNRWTVRPGATGWAQVRRGYNETLEDNIQKLGYDLYYIKNLSIGLDFIVLLETMKILLLGRGAR